MHVFGFVQAVQYPVNPAVNQKLLEERNHVGRGSPGCAVYFSVDYRHQLTRVHLRLEDIWRFDSPCAAAQGSSSSQDTSRKKTSLATYYFHALRH